MQSFLLCYLRESGNSTTSVAMSKSNTQILVLNTILLQRETGLLGEMAGSGVGAGKVKDELGASYSAGKEVLKKKIN